MANRTGKGTFEKNDARINRKGRPKDFTGFRALAQQLAHEEAQARDKETGKLEPVVINGRIVTNAELILRKWLSSSDPRLQMTFMEVAFGKVPTQTEVKAIVSGPAGGPIPIQLVDYRVGITEDTD